MAIIEQSVLLRCKDENGNEYLLYPITRIDCVDGAEDLVHFDKDQKLTAEQKAQFLKNIGGLCAPNRAEANKFLKVTAVDANGNVTAVETIDVEANAEVDDTLSQEGMAADAKAVGEAIASINHITASDDGNGIITLSATPFASASEVLF